MELKQYIKLTAKTEVKSKPKNRQLSKAKQNYLEAQKTINQELKETAIRFESNFLPILNTGALILT